jgi:hypothetical protein
MKIVTYGSLQNKASLEATLSRPVSYGVITIEGYQKIFNAPFGDYAFLNLQKNQSSSFSCLYFEIEPNELTKFAKREAGSDLVEIMPGYRAFIWPTNYCRNLPVLRSYIQLCELAAKQNKLDFWQGTVLPSEVINDAQKPLYKVI